MSTVVEFNIKVECEKCGESLDARFFPSASTLEVEICKNCFDKESNDSYKDGYEEGRAEALKEMEDTEN